jgi:hypothetical protein
MNSPKRRFEESRAGATRENLIVASKKLPGNKLFVPSVL